MLVNPHWTQIIMLQLYLKSEILKSVNIGLKKVFTIVTSIPWIRCLCYELENIVLYHKWIYFYLFTTSYLEKGWKRKIYFYFYSYSGFSAFWTKVSVERNNHFGFLVFPFEFQCNSIVNTIKQTRPWKVFYLLVLKLLSKLSFELPFPL